MSIDCPSAVAATRQERLSWIDVAKGIGILAVVAGHMGIQWIDAMVFPWHMPLFFILSGVFLSMRQDMWSFVVSKSRSLLKPYLFTSLVIIGIYFVRGIGFPVPLGANVFQGISFPESLNFHEGIASAGSVLLKVLAGSGGRKVFGIGHIGAIWFLEALFVALILNRVLAVRKSAGAILLLLAGVAVWSAKYFWLPFNLQSGCLAAVFVFLGYKGRDYVLSPLNPVVAFVGFALGVASFVMCPPLLAMASCSGPLAFYVASPLIVYFVLAVAKQLDRVAWVRRLLVFFGKNSLLVLCLHLIEANLITWWVFNCAFARKFGACGELFVLGCRILLLAMGVCLLLWVQNIWRKKMGASVLSTSHRRR